MEADACRRPSRILDLLAMLGEFWKAARDARAFPTGCSPGDASSCNLTSDELQLRLGDQPGHGEGVLPLVATS